MLAHRRPVQQVTVHELPRETDPYPAGQAPPDPTAARGSGSRTSGPGGPGGYRRPPGPPAGPWRPAPDRARACAPPASLAGRPPADSLPRPRSCPTRRTDTPGPRGGGADQPRPGRYRWLRGYRRPSGYRAWPAGYRCTVPQAASAARVSRFREEQLARHHAAGPDIRAHGPQVTRQRGQGPAGRRAPAVRHGLADRGDGGRQVLGQPGPADSVADVSGHPVVGRERGVLVCHAAWIGGLDQMWQQIARRPRPGQREDHRGPAADPATAPLADAAEAENGQQQAGRDGDERPAQDPAGQRGGGGPVGAGRSRAGPGAGRAREPAGPGAGAGRCAGMGPGAGTGPGAGAWFTAGGVAWAGPGGSAAAPGPGNPARSVDDGTGSPAHMRGHKRPKQNTERNERKFRPR